MNANSKIPTQAGIIMSIWLNKRLLKRFLLSQERNSLIQFRILQPVLGWQSLFFDHQKGHNLR